MQFMSDKTFLKYIDYFHDGELFDIQHDGNNMILPMSSADLEPGEMQDDIHLSNNGIQGKLYIEGIKSIIVNDIPTNERLKFQYDHAEILDFEIYEDKIELGVEWRTRYPKPRSSDYSFIVIEADKVYWENVPNLEENYK